MRAFKATRLDGTDLVTGKVDYGRSHRVEVPTRPRTGADPRTSTGDVLHVTLDPTTLAYRWPAIRLWVCECGDPVAEDAPGAPHGSLPGQLGVTWVRVVAEVDPELVWGEDAVDFRRQRGDRSPGDESWQKFGMDYLHGRRMAREKVAAHKAERLGTSLPSALGYFTG